MGLSVKVVVPHPNVTPGGGTKRGLSTEPLFQQTAWNVPVLPRVGVPRERLRDRPALFWAQPRGSVSLHRRWMRNISRWTRSSEGWTRGRYSPSQRRSGIGGGVSAMLGPEGGLGHSQIHWEKCVGFWLMSQRCCCSCALCSHTSLGVTLHFLGPVIPHPRVIWSQEQTGIVS